MTILPPSSVLFCLGFGFLFKFVLFREGGCKDRGRIRERAGRKAGIGMHDVKSTKKRSFKKQAHIFEELQVTAAVPWVKQKNSNIKKTHWVFSSQDVFLNMYSEIKKCNQKYRILSLTYLITECHTNKFLFTIKIFLI